MDTHLKLNLNPYQVIFNQMKYENIKISLQKY
jgi:hypothetical protein